MIGSLVAAALSIAPLPPLKIQGKYLLDPGGHPVILKGCNLGNWLINEFWMMGTAGRPGTPVDQYELEDILSKRFGASEDTRLMNVFRSSWITERDWKNIRTYPFNLVRIPFNYRLLEDDAHPMVLRSDAWRWLDTAVDQAEAHGMYVILDLHGVQGGQTVQDHTGRSGQNKLWSEPQNQTRMAWLWTQIAARYRSRSAVIGYDPMNEPYGGTKPQVVDVFKKVYAAIRKTDPEKLIFAHGATDNFDHFGDPKANGWHNVGFQMHYYPGLFGDAPRLRSNLRHLNSLNQVAEKIEQLQVPFLVGEMNVVLKKAGGAPMMRRYFDFHSGNAWMTTMWSYKVITPDGNTTDGSWGMFTNAEPAKSVDFRTAEKKDIEAYFQSFATQKLKPYEELREALNAPHPPSPLLPLDEIPLTKAPSDETLPGWTSTDIGGATAGGLAVQSPGQFSLFGGGDDIWSSSDQFRFLHRQATGDFDLSVTVVGLDETSGYAKAGLMTRGSLNSSSSTTLLSVFPSGDVQVGVRDADGGAMSGIDGPKNALPNVRLRIRRVGSTVSYYANDTLVTTRQISGTLFVGPIALSHAGGALTKVSYRDLKFTP